MKFNYSLDNKRYHTFNYHLKKKFNNKVAKISLNAGFTCPNIDGKVGYGGCIYCSKSGSAEFAGNIEDSLIKQFYEIKEVMDKKWKNLKYIAYFQAHSNTYASVDVLKEKYESILKIKDVVGLFIATRPDCINEEIINYLSQLNKRTYLVVELGLQTIHDKTSKLINRCHSLSCFEEAVKKLKQRNIEVVVHIINNLPYETKEMMLDTIRYVNKLKVDGIKIHMLFISKNTPIEKLQDKYHIFSMEEYIDIVCDQLELLDEKIVIHRITSDPDINTLIKPTWLVNKRSILNNIDKELLKRNTYQGFNTSILNRFRQIIINNINESDIVVDATTGNGKDCLFLSTIVKKGFVFGFDIQEEAINKTTNLLNKNNIKNYQLFLNDHQNIDKILNKYKNKISLVVYNLGYLPKSKSNIMTKKESTINSIKASLKLLNNKGFILVVAYPHDEGKKEKAEIYKLRKYNYIVNEYKNTTNDLAPVLLEIKKQSCHITPQLTEI